MRTLLLALTGLAIFVLVQETRAEGSMPEGSMPEGSVEDSRPSDSGQGGAGAQSSGLPKTGDCARYKQEILDAAAKHGLEPELVMAVIQVESGFNNGLKSRAGAMGLMQVMPGTARHMECDDDMYDAESNIECGCRVLRKYIDIYEGNIVYGLSAYNAGPGNTNPSRNESKAPFNFKYVEKVFRWRNVFVRTGCN